MRKKKNLRHIPPDICERILLRLDVKNILRFKCVCRSWCDLISNPSFAFRQLELSKADPEKSHHRILRTNRLATIDYNAFCDYKAFCDYNSFWGENECRWNRISTTQVPGDPPQHPRIVGSCDGLVCLLCYDYKVRHRMLIWNPCSREFLNVDAPPCIIEFYWFGCKSFTTKNGTYNLVV